VSRGRKGPEADKFYVDRYLPERSCLARRVERQALGHEVGVNGYTTVTEAQAMVEHLRLSPDSRNQRTVTMPPGARRPTSGAHAEQS
jgi:hypothetical protein